jgi:hypothetical protein
MPKKRLDATTLEAVAEIICGSGQGAGGGPTYGTPGPYRSKSEIHSFFARAGVDPKGESSTRKWFVLESLQALNAEAKGDLLPTSLEKVLLRLANPKEYRGDSETIRSVTGYLNNLLQIEGIEIVLSGIEPELREKSPGVTPVKPVKAQRIDPPDFSRLALDPSLARILTLRWEEAQTCVEANAFLSAVIMMGSILEGVLLHKVETNLKTACKSKAAPRDYKTGEPKKIHDWGLSSLIDVANEVGWLQGDVKRFSHGLRESRNIVHPYMQRLYQEEPDKDTCSICWQVVRAALADLLGSD